LGGPVRYVHFLEPTITYGDLLRPWDYIGVCLTQKGDDEVGGIDIVFKVAGIGIISIVISLIFEQVGRKDFAWAATVIGAVLVFGVALLRFKELLDEILTVFRLW